MSAGSTCTSHSSTEPRKLQTITAIAIIRLVLATMPPSAMAAWEGAPHSRFSARSADAERRPKRCSGVSSRRASSGIAAMPPASSSAIER